MATPSLPYQFAYNGFLFGNNTPYQIIDIDGLASQPDLRVQDAPRGYNDGFLTGRDFFNGRSMTFTLNIFAGNGNSASQNWLLLQQAMQPVQQLTSSNGLMQFQLAVTDSLKRVTARVRNRKAKIDPNYTYGFIVAQLEFFAPDYRYYTDALVTSATLTPQIANGRIYNRTYNLIYTQATSGNASATTAVDNTSGTAAVGPVITISGQPVNNPQITNLATGAYLQLVANFAASDTVVIDMTNNTVTLNGSNARNLMTGGSQFFTVPAATSQNLYFTATSATGNAVVTYRPAFA
jgi:hypothetical protein